MDLKTCVVTQNGQELEAYFIDWKIRNVAWPSPNRWQHNVDYRLFAVVVYVGDDKVREVSASGVTFPGDRVEGVKNERV